MLANMRQGINESYRKAFNDMYSNANILNNMQNAVTPEERAKDRALVQTRINNMETPQERALARDIEIKRLERSNTPEDIRQLQILKHEQDIELQKIKNNGARNKPLSTSNIRIFENTNPKSPDYGQKIQVPVGTVLPDKVQSADWRIMSTRQETTQISPEERASQTAKGKDKGYLTGSQLLIDTKKALQKDSSYKLQQLEASDPDPAVSIPAKKALRTSEYTNMLQQIKQRYPEAAFGMYNNSPVIYDTKTNEIYQYLEQ